VLSARRRSNVPATVAISDIEDLSHEGRGVSHHEGKAVFIDDALPGERVEWRLRQRGRNFDEAQLERILQPSPDRVTPKCVHFGVCGGCALQHLSAQRQIEFKQRQLTEALARIGRVTPAEVLPPLQAGAWNYRRRARLAARWVPKKNRTLVGFRERSTPFIAELQRCEVLTQPMDDLLRPLSELVTGLSIRDRVPQIEVSVADNAIALVVRILQPLTAADHERLVQFGVQHGVQMYLQPGGYETIAPLQGTAVPLSYRLPQFDVELQFQPTDFIQVNSAINEQMVARAIDLLEVGPSDRVLDLFCGLGNFSLPLARRAQHVVGVEGEAGLVARAGENARRNGIDNAEFFTANLADEDLLDEGAHLSGHQPVPAGAPWMRRPYDKVLLDPPRAGALQVLPIVARSGARRVVYVSCHPGSLARDAGILVHEHGFSVAAAGVMDMFPHTAHVESIAVFTR
jgi:23S rRNA (uracil1939-C5)-methyltransferase